MENKIGFFEEAEGHKSSNRLIVIAGSFWAMLITSYLVYKDVPAMEAAGFFSTVFLLIGSFKLIQKGQETKFNAPKE